ncbi:fimbrial biogenesis chaperone [Cupriavidus pauculus]|uniref:Molecular chaperone EcpD n=1 Tax=Cupriavidus pauculus TaxID=82633 RepID=A0A2N5CE27_9BURK|nr:fimbria/pilus periplasmic chaperone [Cupriavidus pauculus]PLQ00447.1 molecular chaperone EcpD [Cupriavidus pauculus]
MNTTGFGRTVLCAAMLFTGAAAQMQAHASVVISGTRVVYNAKESETTIKLTNEGKTPSLTQVWIDRGEVNDDPSLIDAPFTVSPPVSRIDPGKAQTLRIVYTGEPLAEDKELVFWLNVLDIPPKTSDGTEANKLQLAFRSRIKLFFRPTGIQGSAVDAPDQIQWTLVPGGIEARNPTAYHVSFASIEVTAGGRNVKAETVGMVDPGASKVFTLSGELSGGAGKTVRFHAINDYGGAHRNAMSLKQ